MIAAELLKLRRSAVWVLVVVLPLLAVTTGTVNFVMNQDALSHTWGSYWAQVTLFYGLLYLSTGIAIVASTVWRMEHRGNWPRLLTTPRPLWWIVAAKLVALALLVAVMQLVLLFAGWIAGAVFAGLPPALPGQVVAIVLLAVLPGVAVAAVQSLLSMLVRWFAAPVVVAILGCVVGIGVFMSGQPIVGYLIPYALVPRVLGMTGAITTSPPLSWLEAAKVAGPSLLVACSCVVLGAWLIKRRDAPS